MTILKELMGKADAIDLNVKTASANLELVTTWLETSNEIHPNLHKDILRILRNTIKVLDGVAK